MNSAKAQGKLPAAMQEFFKDLLEPQISWADKIEAFFARKVGNQSYSWSTLDRQLIVRGIGAPGRVGYGCNTIVVGIDTSGSIGVREVETFFGEVRGILADLNPKELLIMWCDAKVHRVDEALDDMDLRGLREKGIPGRGGTSFVPVFDEIYERGLEPDALVYLTDGMGSFPDKAPAYPVLWGNVWPGSKYPFGAVVDVPVQK
jgi:predicted metal-dependent peptidase